ncbi:MAG: pseudouridine synthase [Candidatus Saccharimonas sp.]
MADDQADQSRLNKYLSLHLGLSRRKSDELIEFGRVSINGVTAVLGARISDTDKVAVDGKIISGETELIYLLLNKPIGYVCSRSSQGSKTVYELLPPEYHQLNTVGRLDKDSSGLIMMTNDGDFTFKMTHPKFSKTKLYEVRLDHDLEPLHQQMISDFGLDLEDGHSQFTLMSLSDDNRTDWQVTMTEGRNRQIRRSFASLGYTVKRLHRTNFGDYALGDIKRGEFEVVNIR